MKPNPEYIRGWNNGLNTLNVRERGAAYFRGYLDGIRDRFYLDRARWIWAWEEIQPLEWFGPVGR